MWLNSPPSSMCVCMYNMCSVFEKCRCVGGDNNVRVQVTLQAVVISGEYSTASLKTTFWPQTNRSLQNNIISTYMFYAHTNNIHTTVLLYQKLNSIARNLTSLQISTSCKFKLVAFILTPNSIVPSPEYACLVLNFGH